MKVYGIKNCDTVKKALKFLQNNTIAYEFVDLKTTSLTEEQLKTWLKQPTLINKRSTTYRQLKHDVEACQNEAELIKLIQANPTLLKRPIVEKGELLLIGFDETSYRSQFI